MIRSLLSMACLAAITVSLTACGGTYVNIPAQQGDVAAHDPNDATVRKVMILAIRTATKDVDPGQQLAVSTPRGTTALTEAAIVHVLGGRFVDARTHSRSSKPDIAVTGVRIRGTSAAVDVGRPSATGGRELVTVDMTWQPFNGWAVDNTQVWTNTPLQKTYDQPRPGASASQPTKSPATQPSK